ncbi:MAG: Tat pathway signal protein, partial [Planctomycetota bacterium]
MQYDWSLPISTNKIDVYWWDDRRGVRLPESYELLYWNGKDFVPVRNPSSLGVEEHKYNTTTFDAVRTSRLRLEIDSNENYSTGILEWKVYDTGRSPDFPPRVNAGTDRVVMLKGRTYLNGEIKTLGEKGTSEIAWSKVSGPGKVAFENAGKPVTTATFSKAGDYVLKLTAGKGQLSASSTLTVKAVTPPPEKHLDLIDTKHYKIDNPLWNSRAKAIIVN